MLTVIERLQAVTARMRAYDDTPDTPDDCIEAAQRETQALARDVWATRPTSLDDVLARALIAADFVDRDYDGSIRLRGLSDQDRAFAELVVAVLDVVAPRNGFR